jgi:hypothetical protein
VHNITKTFLHKDKNNQQNRLPSFSKLKLRLKFTLDTTYTQNYFNISQLILASSYRKNLAKTPIFVEKSKIVAKTFAKM